MNEIMDKAKETDDLVLLIEQHKREIWEWKQKESKWLEDKVLLDGTKKLINKLSEELMRMKNRAQEAEGENTIIKGIGNTSPEMKALQERVKRLDHSLANALEINESHQRYNGKLQRRVTELEEDNKKISLQVDDKIDLLRKAGM
jgi:adenylate kinase family enzyme